MNKMRIAVLAIAATLAASAVAAEIPYRTMPEKVFEKKYVWKDRVHFAQSRQYVPTPNPVYYVTAPESALVGARYGPTLSFDKYGDERFTKTVFVKFQFYTSTLNFGVPDYKRTNRFVESQSGPVPIHADSGTLRKI